MTLFVTTFKKHLFKFVCMLYIYMLINFLNLLVCAFIILQLAYFYLISVSRSVGVSLAPLSRIYSLIIKEVTWRIKRVPSFYTARTIRAHL